MPLDRPPVLSRRQAAELLSDVAGGATQVLGALDGAPVLVVDLTEEPDVVLPELPKLLACVVIGLGQPARASDLDGVDLVLARHDAAGVRRVDDLEAALGQLLAAIDASSVASVTLAQILRAGEHLSPAEALLYESLAFSSLQSGAVFKAWLAERPPPVEDTTPPENLVLVWREDDGLHVRLNRPERRNALGARLRDALFAALDLAFYDPTICSVHLSGEGPSFSSGGDLTEFGSAVDGGLAHLIRTTTSVGLRLAALGSRVTVHVHGACVGAGIELPAFAGQVLSTKDAGFRLPEVAMGLIPGAGGTVSIPRRIGRHRTTWLAISGEVLDAPTAREWGLVDEIEPAG